MKNFFLALIIILGLISCKKDNTENLKNETVLVKNSPDKVIKSKDFPLKNLSKVELLSYEDRMVWDRPITKEDNKYYKELVVNFKLNFDSTKIKERVLLNSTLKKELIGLMIQDTCQVEEFVSDCYKPRHMILFRDNKNRIIGYKEFCFSCVGFRESKNLENYNGFCLIEMNQLFKKSGIKFFEEYP